MDLTANKVVRQQLESAHQLVVHIPEVSPTKSLDSLEVS